MKWQNFKTSPPYDAYEDDKNGYETDFSYCYFIYKYKNRSKGQLFVSHKACKFSRGIFEGYESGMKTSPFPVDHIEILYWMNDGEARGILMNSFKNQKL